jgi:hypothetical protein
MVLLAAGSLAVNPLGPFGACVVAGSIVVLIAYLIGFSERRHWGGRPPTPQEYLHGKRKMGRVQYSTSQWSQRVLIVAVIVLVLGIGLLAYGALA